MGRVLDGFTKLVEINSAEQAEAAALVETLDFLLLKLRTNGTQLKLKVHSDCGGLVRSIEQPEESSWDVRPLVDRARAKMKDLPGLTLVHCRRETNKVADWLAKAHRLNLLPTNWVSHPPYALLDLLCADAFDVNSKLSAK